MYLVSRGSVARRSSGSDDASSSQDLEDAGGVVGVMRERHLRLRPSRHLEPLTDLPEHPLDDPVGRLQPDGFRGVRVVAQVDVGADRGEQLVDEQLGGLPFEVR